MAGFKTCTLTQDGVRFLTRGVFDDTLTHVKWYETENGSGTVHQVNNGDEGNSFSASRSSTNSDVIRVIVPIVHTPGGAKKLRRIELYGMVDDRTVLIGYMSDPEGVTVSCDIDTTSFIAFNFSMNVTEGIPVEIANTGYVLFTEFYDLKNRAVTAHAEGSETTGDAQDIYGVKTFKDLIKPSGGILSTGNIESTADGSYNIGASGKRFGRGYFCYTVEAGGIVSSGTIQPSAGATYSLGTSSKTFLNGYFSSKVVTYGLEITGKVTGSLIPNGSGSYHVGSSENKFKNGYFSSTIYAGGVDSSGNVYPSATGTYDVGTDSNNFRNGYFSSTVYAGGVTTSASILPSTTESYDLGSTTSQFRNAYFSNQLRYKNAEIYGTSSSPGLIEPYSNLGANLGASNYRFNALYVKDINASGTITGNLSGNATTATSAIKATQDVNGYPIQSTYVSGASGPGDADYTTKYLTLTKMAGSSHYRTQNLTNIVRNIIGDSDTTNKPAVGSVCLVAYYNFHEGLNGTGSGTVPVYKLHSTIEGSKLRRVELYCAPTGNSSNSGNVFFNSVWCNFYKSSSSVSYSNDVLSGTWRFLSEMTNRSSNENRVPIFLAIRVA